MLLPASMEDCICRRRGCFKEMFVYHQQPFSSSITHLCSECISKSMCANTIAQLLWIIFIACLCSFTLSPERLIYGLVPSPRINFSFSLLLPVSYLTCSLFPFTLAPFRPQISVYLCDGVPPSELWKLTLTIWTIMCRFEPFNKD